MAGGSHIMKTLQRLLLLCLLALIVERTQMLDITLSHSKYSGYTVIMVCSEKGREGEYGKRPLSREGRRTASKEMVVDFRTSKAVQWINKCLKLVFHEGQLRSW